MPDWLFLRASPWNYERCSPCFLRILNTGFSTKRKLSVFPIRFQHDTYLRVNSTTVAFDGVSSVNPIYPRIRSSEKFLSFYEEIMDAQYFSFYIILSNYVWSILFYQDEDRNVWQIRFHVCIKLHRCKRRVCKRKTLFGQPNTSVFNRFR